MKALVAFLRAEPAAVASVIGAAVALAISFGAQLTAGQTGAITALITVVLGLVVRSQVAPVGAGPVVVTPADVTRAVKPPPPPQAGLAGFALVIAMATAACLLIYTLAGFGSITVHRSSGWLGLGLLGILAVILIA